MLTNDCNIDRPPTEANLKNANQLYPEVKDIWEARFLLMYDAYMGQTGNLIDCDKQVGSIRSWNLQHLELKNEPVRTTR